MNHCVLEVEVLEAPTLRYTQDNQTPIAEMTVRFDGLRPDDPPGQLKVATWLRTCRTVFRSGRC